MQVAPSGGGAILLRNLVQVTESFSGSVVPLAMFICQQTNTKDIAGKSATHPLKSVQQLKKQFSNGMMLLFSFKALLTSVS